VIGEWLKLLNTLKMRLLMHPIVKPMPIEASKWDMKAPNNSKEVLKEMLVS
jgi:hypothetical protein